MKETAGNRVTTAARIVPAGGIEPEAEEPEQTDSFEPALEKQDEAEREERFRYLKEFRRQKGSSKRLVLAA